MLVSAWAEYQFEVLKGERSGLLTRSDRKSNHGIV
jgi:hypothetical protein